MRAIAAAEAKLDADAPDTASKLLATAEMGQLDDLQRAQAGAASYAPRVLPHTRQQRSAAAAPRGQTPRTP